MVSQQVADGASGHFFPGWRSKIFMLVHPHLGLKPINEIVALMSSKVSGKTGVRNKTGKS